MANIAKKTIDLVNGQVQIAFGDGVKVDMPLAGIPQEMLTRLALHGLSQKAGDSYASAGDKGWDISDCRAQAKAVYDHLVEGVWSAGGERGGNAVIVEALSRLTGQTVDDCREVYGAMNEEEKKALAKRVDVKAEVAAIRAERLAAKASGMPTGDSDDLGSLFG